MKNLNKIKLKLTGTDISQKREEIKQYFLYTSAQFEKIFELLKDDNVFYKTSEITRHPMIFYFGHTATFFINKLITMKVIEQRINASFESIFAIGVDEMSWDDMDSSNYTWPKIPEVRTYRNKVKDLVLHLIDTIDFTLPIKDDSAMWVILMGIEHEKIHIETSLVLHRQMPIEFINGDDKFPISNQDNPVKQNEMISIPQINILLGKPKDHPLYGWDNEYGKYEEDVQEFQTSKYLVSNYEYLDFVNDKGYENKSYWCQEGLEFLETLKNKYPIFWIKENNTYKYRAINKIIDLPLSWPVDVNALEANAFCKYKSEKENKKYSLPSEVQYKAIYEYAKVPEILDANTANQNLNLYSSCPVDTHSFNGIYDAVGNVWQWSSSTINGLEGFEFHDAYDDFSVPTFDNKHAIINGSSWASTGNLIDKYSRYAFRRHFYQNAGFRYIIDNNKKKEENKMTDNIYETDKLVSQYCEFQYGDEHFGVENFSIACANIAKKYIKANTKAFDIGCATGRLSFELAKYFDHVDGLDFSARFIQIGVALKQQGEISYRTYGEGELFEDKTTSLKDLEYQDLKDKVEFWQGDACNLKNIFTSYDMVLATNLIDRLYDPMLFLNEISSRINKDGILIMTSPYTWLEEYTQKEHWLGGYVNDKGETVNTIDSLQKILKDSFELIDTKDVPFVIKETKRKYQHTIAELSVWRKK